MSEWWTYRLSDFLMFSARTYYRLFELYNAEVWPGHLVALVLGVALLGLALYGVARPRGKGAARGLCALLALGWLWVAWAFHLQRYAAINSAAPGFAAAFAIEGLLLLASAGFAAGWRLRAWRGGRRGVGVGVGVGVGLLLFALALQPALGVLFGRSWRQAELFALAPDPTVAATLGVLLLLQTGPATGASRFVRVLGWLLWPIPLLWCLASGATLWAMQAPDAWVMPAAALLAVLAAWRSRLAAPPPP